jgi:hypothetical protein
MRRSAELAGVDSADPRISTNDGMRPSFGRRLDKDPTGLGL